VPRLSIIVPHFSDDAALESTLLSILENRPSGSELIVVHCGNYSDPYGLAGDELQLVATESVDGIVSLVNEGLRFASAPIVQTLLPGTCVIHDWTASAMAWFHDAKVAAVGIVGESREASLSEYAGLDVRCLPRRARVWKAKRGETTGASLDGGFFRRDILESLGGWLKPASREGAEVDMALAIQALGLKSIHEPSSRVVGARQVIEGEFGGYANGHFSAQLAVAYSHATEHNLVQDSLAAKLGHLAGGLVQPSSVAERLGWVLGLSDRSLVESVRRRIEQAKKRLQSSTGSGVPLRRAA
jgi:hypothetical protein